MVQHNKMDKKFLNKNVGCTVKTTCNTEQVNETQSVIWEGKYWKNFQMFSTIVYNKTAKLDIAEHTSGSTLKHVKPIWKLIARIKETDSLHDVKIKILDIIAFTTYMLLNKEIPLNKCNLKSLQESMSEFTCYENISFSDKVMFFRIRANAMNNISIKISKILKNIEAIIEVPSLEFRRKSNNFSNSSKNHPEKDSSSKIKEGPIINITTRINDMIDIQIAKVQKNDKKFEVYDSKCYVTRRTSRKYTDSYKNNIIDCIIKTVQDIIKEINTNLQRCDLFEDYCKRDDLSKIKVQIQNIEENFILCMIEDRDPRNTFKNLMETIEIKTKSKETVNMVQFFKEDYLKNVNNTTVKKLNKPTETKFVKDLITFETVWKIIMSLTETEEHKDIYAILDSIIKVIKYESEGLNAKFLKCQEHSNNEDCSVNVKGIKVKTFNKVDEKEIAISTLRYEIFWRLMEVISELREIFMMEMLKQNEVIHIRASFQTEKFDYIFAVQNIEDKKHEERQENDEKNKNWFIINMDEYNSFFTDTMLFKVRSEEVRKIIEIEKIKYVHEIVNQTKEHQDTKLAIHINSPEEHPVSEDQLFHHQIIARSVKHICELIQEITELKSIDKIENIESPKDAKDDKLTNPDKTSKQDPVMSIESIKEIFEEMREFVEEMKKMVKTSKDQEFCELDVPINVDSKLDSLLKKHFVTPINTKFAINICHNIKESLSEIKETIEM